MKKLFSRILCLTLAFMLCIPGNTITAMKVQEGGEASVEAPWKLQSGKEFRGVWFAFYDYGPGENEEKFTARFTKVCENAKSLRMTAIIAHVRSHCDAMYKSEYYPWSRYISGKQGVDPGYDPLKIMVELAHKYGLELHAWLNPFRVRYKSTDIMGLSDDNPAKRWLTNKKTSDDRNVLIFEGSVYLNPSKTAVRKLIVNGVREIVENYDVDAIHIDDYFYPDLRWTGHYTETFDAPEYEAYVKKQKAGGRSYMDIVSWRKNNINLLLREIKKAIKEIDSSVQFGVSPAGAMQNLSRDDWYYVDYETWLSNDDYLDYIVPQVYWSLDMSNRCPYEPTVQQWIDAIGENCHAKLYIGVDVNKCGITTEPGWTDRYILRREVLRARKTGKVDGFAFFDYSDLVKEKNAEYVKQLKKALPKQ